jgi:outer membrane protein
MSSGAAGAADLVRPESTRTYDIELEVGAGAALRPAYEGARDYRFSPTGFFSLHYLWLPGLGEVKSGRPTEGFSFGPSFRYVRERDSSEYAALRGLDDVDAAFELGGRFAYTFGMFRPWVAVRYGLGGHNGIVGEAGLDMILRPTPVTELTFGPRTSFANREYMQTYLGVTPLESATSGLAPYAPGGGFKGVGAEATGRYQFTPQWAVIGSVTYERLIGDAADSPIVQAGDDDQFVVKLGLSYRFGLKIFN